MNNSYSRHQASGSRVLLLVAFAMASLPRVSPAGRNGRADAGRWAAHHGSGAVGAVCCCATPPPPSVDCCSLCVFVLLPVCAGRCWRVLRVCVLGQWTEVLHQTHKRWSARCVSRPHHFSLDPPWHVPATIKYNHNTTQAPSHTTKDTPHPAAAPTPHAHMPAIASLIPHFSRYRPRQHSQL